MLLRLLGRISSLSFFLWEVLLEAVSVGRYYDFYSARMSSFCFGVSVLSSLWLKSDIICVKASGISLYLCRFFLSRFRVRNKPKRILSNKLELTF